MKSSGTRKGLYVIYRRIGGADILVPRSNGWYGTSTIVNVPRTIFLAFYEYSAESIRNVLKVAVDG